MASSICGAGALVAVDEEEAVVLFIVSLSKMFKDASGTFGHVRRLRSLTKKHRYLQGIAPPHAVGFVFGIESQ
jgi:hypothetical protein